MAHPKIGGCSSAGVSATPMDLKVSATPLDSKCDSKCDSKHIGLPARLMDPFGPSNFAYTFESRIVSPVLPPNFGSAHYKYVFSGARALRVLFFARSQALAIFSVEIVAISPRALYCL